LEKQILKTDIGSILTTCLSHSIREKDGFAVFRLPGSGRITLISGKTETISLADHKLEDSPEGFILAPFDNNGKAHFISAERLISFDASGEIISERGCENLLHSGEAEPVADLPAAVNLPAGPDYMQLVRNAVQEIKENRLKKVVLARTRNISTDVKPARLFLNLCKFFPNSFLSLVWHPDYGVWAGASPEILVSLNSNKIFRTVALAGTQKLQDGQTEADAVWRQKEIEEQALVSRYIINCFKSIRLREYEEEGPKTARSGSLVHLKTIYSVDTIDVNAPYLLSTMINLLHPTSAVGGMPREEAIRFIRENEKLDRSLFSGFTGPVNIENSTDIFVNIRCARLFKEGAQLYAGAGITEESVAENEFIETEIKMDTIGNFLR
jgi:isochorismate synthase